MRSANFRFVYKTSYYVCLLLLLFFNNANPGRSLADVENALVNLVHYTIDLKKAARIDSFFTAKHHYRAFNGSALFAEKGRIIYEGAFGYSNFRKKDTLQITSAFQLASVSKPLTAFAILMLYEKGKLDLEDDVRKFYPEFPYEGITIRMLLSHRSGLPNYMYFADQLWPNRRIPITNQDVIRLMVQYKPARYYRPDTRFNYSNTNYCLLAAIVEKISGMPFEDFMREEVFEPLGMHHTFIYRKGKTPLPPNAVIGYDKSGNVAEDSYLNGVVGDKGVYSTVEDLAKFDRALNEGILVSRTTLEKAFQPMNREMRGSRNYGLGWRITFNKKGHRIVYHTGWWKGFKTYFVKDIKEQKTIIALTNTIRGNYLTVRELTELF